MSRISRFDFLRGDFSGKRVPIRPPWALPEPQFLDTCTRCDACIAACPEHIITTDRGNYPVINFKAGECTFCGDCVAVCKDAALFCADHEFVDTSAWSIKAAIQPNCLAANGIECRVCGEHCESVAIRFRLTAGLVANPGIDHKLCNGCGACVAVCPVDAVHMGNAAAVMQPMNNDIATAL